MPWHVYLPHGQRKIDPLLYTEKCGTLGPALNISLSELDRRARSTMYMESPPLPSPPNFPPKSSHAKLILGDLGPRNRWHRLHRSLWTQSYRVAILVGLSLRTLPLQSVLSTSWGYCFVLLRSTSWRNMSKVGGLGSRGSRRGH